MYVVPMYTFGPDVGAPTCSASVARASFAAKQRP